MKNRRLSRTLRNAAEPKWLLVFAFFIAGGLFGGLGIYLTTAALQHPTAPARIVSKDLNFINPGTAIDQSIQQNFSTASNDLQLKIAGIVSQAASSHDIQEAGVYFQDLDAGTWLSLNSNMTFSPGKLLKLPILISYYKLAEKTPDILDKNIQASDALASTEDLYGPTHGLIPGGQYTVSDLLTSRDFISLKRYSLFFRALYRASYLSPEYSQKALELLSRNRSQSLLEVSLPQSLQFVNRVGARSYVKNGTHYFETYECDIVYFKSHHDYLLCAAADAKSLAATKALFDSIGKAIYSDVSYRYNQ
jgi:hypothetical protein